LARAGFLHDLGSLVLEEVAEGVVDVDDGLVLAARIGDDKLALLCIELADYGVDECVLGRNVTAFDRHCEKVGLKIKATKPKS